MKTIFIQNNISQALEFIHDLDEYKCFFILSNNAKGMRKESELKNYKYLKNVIPEICTLSLEDMSSNFGKDNYFFGNNAYDENVVISKSNSKTGHQNRLLDHLQEFNLKSYTPFRKYVELGLPKRFEDNIYQHDDPEVASELSYYFEETHLAKKYFEIRNGVLGRDYSTKFSQYLASGRLNVRYLYNYLKDYEDKYGSNKSTYWIQFELLWREFFYWSYQKHGQRYFSQNGIQGVEDYERQLPALDFASLFKDDPFMVSVLNELIETGFISNRFRQVFASSLINKYKIDWRQGATLFEQFLIDYDVYSNWGNWQYLAGVGHDPRGLRLFNVNKQIQDHDSNLDYICKWSKFKDVEKIHQILEVIYPQHS